MPSTGVTKARARTTMVAVICCGLIAFAKSPPSISIQGAPTRGNADARVVVIEYSDFQCPYCGKFARETFGAIEERYIGPGKVRYVFRNFPLDESHPKAFKAAEAGECANQQGKFWEMHAQLFANQQALDPADLVSHSKVVGLEESAFRKCLNGAASGKIRRDFNDGVKAGVGGTPTFLIGTAEKDGKVRVVKTLSGMQTTESFTRALDEVLAASVSGLPGVGLAKADAAPSR
jgi:protein-disulfide isomerase